VPSITIDVAIGLVFIFVLLSLIATAVTEWVTRAMGLRSKLLEAGIRNLLNDPALTLRLYNHPLIKALYREGDKPSYLSATTFTIALLDLLGLLVQTTGTAQPLSQIEDTVAKLPDSDAKNAARDLIGAIAAKTALGGIGAGSGAGSGPAGGIADDSVARAVAALINAAGGDRANSLKNIESWFDSAMERVSGWYKRCVQVITLGCALIVAVGLNADTVMIANGLSREPVLRAAVVSAASQATQQPLSSLDLAKVEKEFQELKVPIGWSGDPADGRGLPDSPSAWLAKIVGLLLTTVAVSLGAPFWFDLLNKLVNLRATGNPPQPAKP